MITPDHIFLNWVADRLVHFHGENPNVDYVLSLRERAEAAKSNDVRQIPVPSSTGINAWIDEQVATQGNYYGDKWLLTPAQAAEVARGAALAIVADRETLIMNLRRAGYVVSAPGEENFR